MPLPDADAHARERIEHHRQQMALWHRARAARLAAEREAGKSVEEIAAELGISAATVYDILRAVPPPRTKGARRGRPRRDEENDDRDG